MKIPLVCVGMARVQVRHNSIYLQSNLQQKICLLLAHYLHRYSFKKYLRVF